MDKLEKNQALFFLDFTTDKKTILKIMERSGYNDDVCKKGLKILNIETWPQQQLLSLMAETSHKNEVSREIACYLTLENMTLVEISNLFNKIGGYHGVLIKIAVHYIKKTKLLKKATEEEIINLLNAVGGDEFYKLCQPYLKLSEKTDEELMALYRRLNHHYCAPLMIAPYLSSWNYLFEIMKKDDTSQHEIQKICLVNFKLSEKTDDILMALVAQSEYDSFFCAEVIRWLISKTNVLLLVSGRPNDMQIAAAAIKRSDSDIEIMLILEKFKHWKDMLLVALGRLKSNENILKIWKEKKYEDDIRKKALKRLNLKKMSEGELVEVIKLDEFSNDAARACAPYLDLPKKTPLEIAKLLKKTDFNRGACQVFMPYLKLEKKNELELVALSKFLGSATNVDRVMIKFLHSPSYILSVIDRSSSDEEAYWEKAFRMLLKGKTDSELSVIAKELKYNERALEITIQALTKIESIMALLNNDGYLNKKLIKAAADRLKTIRRRELIS